VPFTDVEESCAEARRVASLGLKISHHQWQLGGPQLGHDRALSLLGDGLRAGLVCYVHHNPFSCQVSDHLPTTYTLGWERDAPPDISNYLGFAFEYMVGMASLTLGEC